jgi:RibD C-terminal domain
MGKLIVYSRTLAEPRSARTRVEREFDPDTVRRLKADAEHDISVDGPELAAQAIRAGLVDEFQMIVCPAVVGGGKRFFPDDERLDQELLEERRFGSGVLILQYGVRRSSRGLAFGREVVSGSLRITSPPLWLMPQATCVQSFKSPEFARPTAARWLSMRCRWR